MHAAVDGRAGKLPRPYTAFPDFSKELSTGAGILNSLQSLHPNMLGLHENKTLHKRASTGCGRAFERRMR
jgi:hypothetical protein